MKYSKIVKKECPMCGEIHFVKLTDVEYDQYKKYIAYGSLIQNALSNTSPTVREFLKTGYCPECQELLFGKSEQKELFFSYDNIREDVIKEMENEVENNKKEMSIIIENNYTPQQYNEKSRKKVNEDIDWDIPEYELIRGDWNSNLV